MTTGDFHNGDAGARLASDLASGVHTPKVIVTGATIDISASLAYPTGAVPMTNASGNKANASAVATLANDATLTVYITGFEVTASGAAAGLPVVVTVTGILGGTLSYIFTFPAGVLVGAAPLIIEFPAPIPAVDINTSIVVTLPAGGTGNTNAAVVAHGYKV